MKTSLLGFILLVAIFATGCQVIDQDRVHSDKDDNIPWNTRAGWEGQTIGLPY